MADKQAHGTDRILVTLDCLIDTRLGVIAQAYPDKVAKILNRKYYERIQDVFPGINQEEFKTLWKNRNTDTLKSSMMTNIHLLMESFIRSSAKDVMAGGQLSNMIFDINIHPYVMDDEERQDLIGILEAIVGDAPEYNIISVPNEFLTPQHCKANYQVMVMYDFADWMRMHAPIFKEFRMPDLLIYAPQLLEKLPSPEEAQEMEKAGVDPFEASRIAAAPAFGIRYLTIDMYCIRDPERDVKQLQMKHVE